MDASQVWRRLGIYAARANQIPVQGYGSVMDQDQLGVFTRTWKQLIDALVTAIFRDDYRTQRGRLTTSQRRQLDAWTG